MKTVKNKIARWFVNCVFALNGFATKLFVIVCLECILLRLRCRSVYFICRLAYFRFRTRRLKRRYMIMLSKSSGNVSCDKRTDDQRDLTGGINKQRLEHIRCHCGPCSSLLALHNASGKRDRD